MELENLKSPFFYNFKKEMQYHCKISLFIISSIQGGITAKTFGYWAGFGAVYYEMD